MGAITPGVGALPYEALGVGPPAIARAASDARVSDPGQPTAVRATPDNTSQDAGTFVQALIKHKVPTDGLPTARVGPAGGRGADPAPEQSLSAAAIAIADALASPQSQDIATGLAPLLASLPDAMLLSDLVALLATGLQTSVARSGLFYESHLARWVAGAYPTAQLAEEPQMRSARLAAAIATVRTARAATLNEGGSAPGTAAAPPPGPSLPPPVAAVVRQQLQVLTQPMIVLQVAPWPGARATLRMTPAWPWRAGDGRNPHRSPRRPKPWILNLQLRTRNLGTVTARLDFEAERVQLRLRADHWTAARLHVGVPQLRRRLKTAGIHQTDIEVTEDGAAA